MIQLNRNERLKELGFRILIPVHDEIIAECPEEYASECAQLLADTMSKAAEEILEMPIKCDVEVTRRWYGESVELA
jgi:DNA polymerase-1